MTTATVTPGQSSVTVEFGGSAHVEVGTVVRYHGTHADQHGYYRVLHVLGTGRYNLNEGTGLCEEGTALANVRRASFSVVCHHPHTDYKGPGFTLTCRDCGETFA